MARPQNENEWSETDEKSYTSGNQKEVQQSVDLVDYVRSLSLGWLGHVIRTDYQILTKFIQVETNRK